MTSEARQRNRNLAPVRDKVSPSYSPTHTRKDKGMNLTFYKLIFLINLLRCQWSPLKYLEPFLCEKGRERLLYNLRLTQILSMLVVVHVFSVSSFDPE